MVIDILWVRSLPPQPSFHFNAQFQIASIKEAQDGSPARFLTEKFCKSYFKERIAQTPQSAQPKEFVL